MADTVVSQGSAVIAIGTESGYDASVSLTGTILEGDVIWAVQVCDGSPTNDYPQGFTPVFQSGDALPRMSVSYLEVGATPPSTIAVGRDATYLQTFLWQVRRGQKVGDLLGATPTTEANSDGDITCPSIVVETGGSTLMVFGGLDDQSKAASVTAPGGLDGSLIDDTHDFDFGGNCTAVMGWKTNVSAGATGPNEFTITATDDTWGVSVEVNIATAATVTASGGATVPAMTGAGTGERTVTASGGATNPVMAGAGTGERVVTGTGAGSLPSPTGSGVALRALEGAGGGTAAVMAGAGVATRSVTSQGGGELPAPVGSGVHSVGFAFDAAGVLPELTGYGVASIVQVGVAVGVFPAMSGDGTVVRGVSGSGAASMPPMHGSGSTLPLGGMLNRGRMSMRVGLSLGLSDEGGVLPPPDGFVVASGGAFIPKMTGSGASVRSLTYSGAASIPAMTGAGDASASAIEALFDRAGQSIMFGVWPDDDNTLSAFETWLGAPADLVSHHPDATSGWAGMVANIAARGAAATYDNQIHWSVPFMLRTGNSLAAAAAGDYDADHVSVAQALISAHNHATNPIIVRGPWEFNLASQPWNCANATDDANFKAAWIRWVNNFRSVSDRFLFEWCPNGAGGLNRDVTLAYPGDAYVDLIGVDLYNHEPTNAGYFGYQRDDANAGITYIHDFAVAHNKPFTMPEVGFTGTSGAAYLTYPADLMAIARTYNVLYMIYWNSDLDFDGVLSDGSKPEIGALVQAEFGQPTITSADTSTLNGDGVTAFSFSLTSGHDGAWSLSNNADGFTLDGSTLELTAQTYAGGGDNERTVTIDFVDERGLTTSQNFTLTVLDPVTDLYPSDYAVMDMPNNFFKRNAEIGTTAAEFLAFTGINFNVDPEAGFSSTGYTPASDSDLEIELPAGGRFSIYLTIDTPAHQSGVYQTPIMIHSTAYPGGTNIECALDGYDSSSPFNLGRAVRVNGTTVVNSTWTTIATGQTNKIGIVVDGAGIRFFKNGTKVNTVVDTSFDTAYTLNRLRVGNQFNGTADFAGLIRLVRVKLTADDDATAESITT